MKERLPKVCLVIFWVVGLFVIYQSEPENELFPPLIVSHTLVVPAIRWPQPPGIPAGSQLFPPWIPPWKRSYGRVKNMKSPLQLPPPPATLPVQGANGSVQFLTQR